MRRDLEKRLARLEARRAVKGRRVVTLLCHHGEEPELNRDAWRRSNPLERADDFIHVTLFGEPPRLDRASEASVREVLPHVRAFLLQSPDPEAEAGWREVAKVAGVDFDAIEPESVAALADAVYGVGPARRPYTSPQDPAQAAQSNDLG